MDSSRLREIFDKDTTFAIVVGSAYTADEMAGALSFYLVLSSLGKNVSVISQKQPIVEVSNLVGIDKVKSSFESKNGDLIVSFPYQENEIGKVSYTLEAGFLNIIVKPKDSALSFGEKDVIFKKSGEAPGVIIAVGVKRLSDLQPFFNIESLKDTVIVNIDKAGTNEGYGDIVLISQGASSVSEQIANIILTLSYPMDPDISQNLMDGIISSTQNFQSSNSSSLAFEMAGILLRNGAIRESFISKTPQTGIPNRAMQSLLQNRMQQRMQPPMPRSVGEFPSQQTRSASPLKTQDDSLGQAKDDQALGTQEAPPDWLSPKIFKGSTNVE